MNLQLCSTTGFYTCMRATIGVLHFLYFNYLSTVPEQINEKKITHTNTQYTPDTANREHYTHTK